MNWSVFDPGNIIPDSIFYDTTAMTDFQIRDFIDAQGAGCTGEYCLKNLKVSTPDQPADHYCAAYLGGVNEDAAAVLGKVSRACWVNPQVMLVTLQKEAGLLSRPDPTASTYDAAWGWHCPDTGPGGSANCDPAYAGFFNQAYGMAKQWSRYRVDPYNYNYRAGQTVNILWNVVESGCGSAPVTIANTATASLYNYTPYQPNAAALASYPGTGDACSAYGNRNFFFLFGKYFGGSSRTASNVTLFASTVAATTQVTIPNNAFVDPALAGRSITAPTASVAAGLAAGFAALGLPYVWGGGGSGSGPNNGCERGGGALNSCGPEIGFDCSGLTAFVLGRAGFMIPGDSSSQRAVGTRITWDLALPGDVVGFPGHVAVYLGAVNGVRYILEASTVGTPVHIVKLTRSDADPQVYRFWAGIPQIGANGSTFIPASPWSNVSGTGSGRSYYSTIPRYFPVAPPVAAALPSPIVVDAGQAALATSSASAPTAAASSSMTPAPTSESAASAASTSATATATSAPASPTGPVSSIPASSMATPSTSSATTPAPTTPVTTTPAQTTPAQTTTAAPTTAVPTTGAQNTAPQTTVAQTTAAQTTATPAVPTSTSEPTPPPSSPASTTSALPTVPPASVADPSTPVPPENTPSAPPAPPAATCSGAPESTPTQPVPTVSIPTAPPLVAKDASYSAPTVKPTLFMTVVTIAMAAMAGDSAEQSAATC